MSIRDAAVTAELPFNMSYWGLSFSCEHFGSSIASKGVFRKDGEKIFTHPLPFLLLQLGLGIIFSAVLRWLLRPLKQPRFVAEMLAGILLGPSIFELVGLGEYYESLHTFNQTTLMTLLELFSLATFCFIVGVRTDLSVIKTSGKLSWIIGAVSFATPLLLCFATIELINNNPDKDQKWISVLAASTSFQVTSLLLEDLKLLNSEIGRLAMSSSLISSLGSWIFQTYNSFIFYGFVMDFTPEAYLKSEIPRIICILLIIFVLRPLMFRMMRSVPEGGYIKEWHFFVVFVMFLAISVFSESLGYKAYFGGMVLGLAVPPGPPLGAGLVEKLEMFIAGVLLPAYIIDAGRYVNVFSITWTKFSRVETFIIVGFLGKLLASVVPLVLYKMPYKDSFTLGLILSSQGFFDVLSYKLYLRFTLIKQDIYSVMTIMTVVNAAIVTPLICHLYDPSKRYMNYKRRTIQQSLYEQELRIVLCVYEEDQVFSFINLLNASHHTRERPIGAFVLDLMELVGRDHPVLVNHQFHKLPSSPTTTHTRTDRIINAFRHYEMRAEGSIKTQHFTAITTYVTMHDDICTLALERTASLLIIPFHKSESSGIRGVTKNVLDKAPCSVGILIDKQIIINWRSDSRSQAKLKVCVIFLGGADSREALAYGMRMIGNPTVRLTVIRLIAEDEFISDLMETKLDYKAINDLKNMYETNEENIEYKEVIVKDGAETSRVLLAIDDHYDFMLVGRRIDSDSSLVAGLTDWSYVPELGIIGDILASSDMKINASILVLQQQSTVEDFMNKS